MAKTTCPCCLGTGEEFVKGKRMETCKLCNGEGKVSTELAEDYIHSINEKFDEDFADY